jgi:hypothetical protein
MIVNKSVTCKNKWGNFSALFGILKALNIRVWVVFAKVYQEIGKKSGNSKQIQELIK